MFFFKINCFIQDVVFKYLVTHLCTHCALKPHPLCPGKGLVYIPSISEVANWYEHFYRFRRDVLYPDHVIRDRLERLIMFFSSFSGMQSFYDHPCGSQSLQTDSSLAPLPTFLPHPLFHRRVYRSIYHSHHRLSRV
ncbi:unnamed protein product [Phytomonas sp. EM1]|nr:unnamed protein product [Phytomonas sp. EM1]|eukprot:CCW61545.1 unnamed protein product [Phytomonas sp. isolate EM1]